MEYNADNLHDEFLVEQWKQCFALGICFVFSGRGEFFFWTKADANEWIARTVACDRSQIPGIYNFNLCKW